MFNKKIKETNPCKHLLLMLEYCATEKEYYKCSICGARVIYTIFGKSVSGGWL